MSLQSIPERNEIDAAFKWHTGIYIRMMLLFSANLNILEHRQKDCPNWRSEVFRMRPRYLLSMISVRI